MTIEAGRELAEPLVLHGARLSSGLEDSVTSEDPLPLVLETTEPGYVLAHSTRLTRVRSETTDDS